MPPLHSLVGVCSQDEAGGDDSDVFETPLKPRKRAKLAETPTSTAGGKNKNASAANNKASTSNPSPKLSQTKKATGGKGKGRATNPSEASPSPGASTPASPGDKGTYSPAPSSETGTPVVCSNASITATPVDATPTPSADGSRCSDGQGSGMKEGGGREGQITPASAVAAAPQPKAKTPKVRWEGRGVEGGEGKYNSSRVIFCGGQCLPTAAIGVVTTVL